MVYAGINHNDAPACHDIDVMYVMAEDLIRDYDRDGKLLYDSRTDKARSKTPYTIWMPPQAPHSVENLSKTPLRLLRVELKQ
jgi:hypothetical protein